MLPFCFPFLVAPILSFTFLSSDCIAVQNLAREIYTQAQPDETACDDEFLTTPGDVSL